MPLYAVLLARFCRIPRHSLGGCGSCVGVLRQSVRVGKKFKKRTLANLISWSEERLQELEEALRLRRVAETREERLEAASLILSLYGRFGPLPLVEALTIGHFRWFGKG